MSELRLFFPKHTDDLRPECVPYIGQLVTVTGWYPNEYWRDRYPDDELCGHVEEWHGDTPESELIPLSVVASDAN